jgi:D-lactate dehydrogenase (cytochrome)
VYAKIVEKAIDLGGTATGEHGVGMGKREYLEREHGPVAVELMRRVKGAFDPNDTLNPGKVFPETAAEGGRVRLELD